MPAQFPSQARKPSSEKSAEGRPDTVALEITHSMDTPGSSALDRYSFLAHCYPFAPYVGGAFMTTGSGAITSSLSEVPGTFTPGGKPSTPTEQAPEKNLTLFAMRLAVLEKVASKVGTLAFIWATVVLLGGYAITLKEVDFWFVTVILVIEGARIFSRSHELEWQHEDGGTVLGSLFSRAYQKGSDIWALTLGRESLSNNSKVLDNPLLAQTEGNGNGGDQHHRKRTWSSSSVPLVPVFNRVFQARYVSRLLYWMQLLSAMVSTALSIYRLKTRNFTRPDETNTERNHTAALLIFYSLATLEALVFLLERTYWEFQISVEKILVRVTIMCQLDAIKDLGTTRRFFYDVYSKCLTESIFDGLKMDMVDYALTWLQSDTPGEQLGGLRVLLKFSSRKDISEDTLRSIVVKQGAVERLVEMVTWKNPEVHEIREAAADLLGKLVKYDRYSVRVAAISGSIEGIFSLLSQDDDQTSGDAYENFRQGASECITSKILGTHIAGLRILKNLAKDPLNCAKIGATRGLLARLVSFIHTDEGMLRNAQAERPDNKIALVKKSLELLNLLAGASGAPGKMLREEIAKIVFTISNLRNLLEYGQAHDVMLQDLATEILSSLAMHDDVREMIGQTGGVMCSLLKLLMKGRVDGNEPQVQLAQKAGVVLALLALKSKDNCLKMLRLKVCDGGLVVVADGEEVAKEAAAADGAEIAHSGRDMVAALLELVPDWKVGPLAMIILRSFLAYSDQNGHSCKVRIATSCTKQLLKLSQERSGRPQEAALGLLAKTVTELEAGQLKQLLQEERLSPEALAARVVDLLERNPTPLTALPCLRRFCVELAVGLAERLPAAFLPAFRKLNFCTTLHRVADSSSELENYATFRGVVGVIPHPVTMSCLVDTAIRTCCFPTPS